MTPEEIRLVLEVLTETQDFIIDTLGEMEYQHDGMYIDQVKRPQLKRIEGAIQVLTRVGGLSIASAEERRPARA